MAAINRICICLAIILGCAGAASARSLPTDTFRLANDALNRGAVDDAIQLYRSITDKGYKSLPLYFNLGSAYATKKEWASARLFLELAQLEDPLDADVQMNLDYVKDVINDPYRYPKYPLFSFIEFVHSKTGRNTINWLLLVSFLLAATTFYFKFTGNALPVKFLVWPAVILLIVSGMLVFFEQTYERFHNRMLILYEASSLYQAPDDYAESVTQLQEGYKLRIIEDLGPWIQVDCADGTEGWIPSDKVRPLKKG